MEKQDYLRTEMDVLKFDASDVIATSGESILSDHYEGGGY